MKCCSADLRTVKLYHSAALMCAPPTRGVQNSSSKFEAHHQLCTEFCCKAFHFPPCDVSFAIFTINFNLYPALRANMAQRNCCAPVAHKKGKNNTNLVKHQFSRRGSSKADEKDRRRTRPRVEAIIADQEEMKIAIFETDVCFTSHSLASRSTRWSSSEGRFNCKLGWLSDAKVLCHHLFLPAAIFRRSLLCDRGGP